MPPRAASTASVRDVWRRFRRNGRGSAAVEFALVAPVFFALLFAIIETGIMFFASQELETITQESARMVLTGQAQTASYTQAQFQNYVCSQIPVPALFRCGNIYVDVESYPSATGTSCSTFSNVVINNQIDSQRQFHQQHAVQPRRPRRYRYREAVLSMAAIRHRAWLQHREFVGQQAIAGGHGCILQRALLEQSDEIDCGRSWLRARLSAASLMKDRRGIAATEFAFIVPIMLVMFFGTVEFSSGIAVDRKVTLMARTLADLTSQSVSVANSDLTNFFSASNGIMTPYDGTPTKATISELYVDPKTLQARVQWSQGRRASRDQFPRCDTGSDGGWRDLSAVQRSQLSLRARRRLRDGEGRNYAARRSLYPAAPVALRFLSDDKSAPRQLSDVVTAGERRERTLHRSNQIASLKSKGRADSTAFFSRYVWNFESLGFCKPDRTRFAQPAARRLSAEDLPERRSATIS